MPFLNKSFGNSRKVYAMFHILTRLPGCKLINANSMVFYLFLMGKKIEV